MLLIPAIDLLGGRCVRLKQGDFRATTHYAQAAGELLARYATLGAPWVHVVDLDGARDGRLANHALIDSLARTSAIKLQVGGGVRSTAVVEELLAAGVGRVVVGSAAVEAPQEVAGWLARFTPERVCLAFDVRVGADAVPRVRTRGWAHGSELDLWSAVEPYIAQGLRHVLCTDIECDGMRRGPNFALYREAMRRWPRLCWQASGGVRDRADLALLADIGVAAAVSGTAMLEERINHEELLAFLPNASSPASMSVTAQ